MLDVGNEKTLVGLTLAEKKTYQFILFN